MELEICQLYSLISTCSIICCVSSVELKQSLIFSAFWKHLFFYLLLFIFHNNSVVPCAELPKCAPWDISGFDFQPEVSHHSVIQMEMKHLFQQA